MKTLIYILMLCFVITGCSIGKKRQSKRKAGTKKCFNEKMLIIRINQISQMKKAADHLASLAASVPGVNDATAVVVGKYAIVGD